MSDIRGGEDIVTQLAVALGRKPQLSDTSGRPVEAPQYVVQPEKHRDLRQHRQAAQDGIESVLALQLLHFQRHPLTVFAVLLLQRLDLRLQLLHLSGGTDLANERVVQDRPQREHEKHHRQRTGEEARGAQQEGERLVPEPHDRRDRVIEVVQAEWIKRQQNHSPLASLGYPSRRPGLPGAPVSGPILPDATDHTWPAGRLPAQSPAPTHTRPGRPRRTGYRSWCSGRAATAARTLRCATAGS